MAALIYRKHAALGRSRPVTTVPIKAASYTSQSPLRSSSSGASAKRSSRNQVEKCRSKPDCMTWGGCSQAKKHTDMLATLQGEKTTPQQCHARGDRRRHGCNPDITSSQLLIAKGREETTSCQEYCPQGWRNWPSTGRKKSDEMQQNDHEEQWNMKTIKKVARTVHDFSISSLPVLSEKTGVSRAFCVFPPVGFPSLHHKTWLKTWLKTYQDQKVWLKYLLS